MVALPIMVRIITERPSRVVLPEFEIGQRNWDAPHHLAVGQLGMASLFRTVALEPGGDSLVLPRAAIPLDVASLRFADPLRPGRELDADQFLNRRVYNDALLVVRRGEILHESYRNGMDANDRHLLHSCTKSLCAMLVAIAEAEGRIHRAEAIAEYIPELKAVPAWQGVTVQQVLDMQAGIAYSEDYTDPDADYWRYARAAGYYPPLAGEEVIGVRAWMFRNLVQRCASPGTVFAYNSCLTNMLAVALEAIYGCGFAELMEGKLYRGVGAETEGYLNTDAQGFPIVEGQLSLRLRDFGRIAMLVLNDGRNLAGERVLPAGFCERITQPDSDAQQAYRAGSADDTFPEGQYRDQFWVLDPGRSQFAMLGIHGQFAWIDLERELLMVGFGSYPQQDGRLMMAVLNTLWQTIARST